MKFCVISSPLAVPFGDAEAIRMIAEAGFDGIDFSMFDRDYGSENMRLPEKDFIDYYRSLADTARKYGIRINQVHSAFPAYREDPETDKLRLECQKKSILAAHCLESKYIVVHPCAPKKYKYDFYRAESRVINYNFYTQLAPLLREYDMKLGVENMFSYDEKLDKLCPTVCSSAEEMLDYVDMLGRDAFCACLDLGHSILSGSGPVDMIEKLAPVLETLHVHDNSGVNDDHTIPYLGKFDWDKIVDALKRINYRGMFSFETDAYFYKFPKEMRYDAYVFLRKAAEKMWNK